MLLQTLNALFFRGLPGSQELNQQLANHFIAKVEHCMHIPQLLLCHVGYLRHAFSMHSRVELVRHDSGPTAALPAAGASPA